jgi:hypothetical protein
MLTKALELAAQITHPVTAAIFAAVLALTALIVLTKGKKKPPQIAWALAIAIFLLGLSPLLASTYLDSRGIYRVRIEVLGLDKQPVQDARMTSSAGGEMKKTDAGWEFTIPPQNKPIDGMVTFRASQPDAYLAGFVTLKLARDYFPEIALQLSPLPSGTARGVVEDEYARPVEGARVLVLGYDETVTTGPTGSFSLPAHAADGQKITVFAQKGDKTAQTTAYAGRTAELVLRKPPR